MSLLGLEGATPLHGSPGNGKRKAAAFVTAA